MPAALPSPSMPPRELLLVFILVSHWISSFGLRLMAANPASAGTSRVVI
jgi:hypothetical protein